MFVALLVAFVLGAVSGGFGVYKYLAYVEAEAAKLKAAAQAEVKSLESKL